MIFRCDLCGTLVEQDMETEKDLSMYENINITRCMNGHDICTQHYEEEDLKKLWEIHEEVGFTCDGIPGVDRDFPQLKSMIMFNSIFMNVPEGLCPGCKDVHALTPREKCYIDVEKKHTKKVEIDIEKEIKQKEREIEALKRSRPGKKKYIEPEEDEEDEN